MQRQVRLILFGIVCAIFGYGLAFATLPERREAPRTSIAKAPLKPATRDAASPPPPAPSIEAPAPPPKAVSPTTTPSPGPAAATPRVERKSAPGPAPSSAPRRQSLLAGFRLLGPGQSGGVRLARVAPGTLPAALGLQSYDELISINGYRLSDPEQALLAYARLRTADRLELALQRQGAPTQIVYFVR